jgi:hypothetical protein
VPPLIKSLAAGLVLALLSGCSEGENSILVTTLPNSAKENLPKGAIAGDTVRLYAVEVGPDNSPTESLGRQSFTWTTTTPDIVDIPASGYLVTKVAGKAQVVVKGLKAERMFDIWLYPSDARVRIEPRDVTVNAGETVPMTTSILYGTSSVFQDAATSQATYTVVTTNPEILRPSEGLRPPFTAIRAGVTWVRASLELYKRSPLRDSVRITVK